MAPSGVCALWSVINLALNFTQFFLFIFLEMNMTSFIFFFFLFLFLTGGYLLYNNTVSAVPQCESA